MLRIFSTVAVLSGALAICPVVRAAVKEADGWRILGVMWQAESPGAPIPAEYAP